MPVRAGFFIDDQAAIRAGAEHDGFGYAGPPVTPGFRRIREPGRAVSVLLVLDDGEVAHGDCATVQYIGVGGRDPVLDVDDACEQIRSHVRPLLIGRALGEFVPTAQEMDQVDVGGRPLHTAIRYGATQAVLDAVARSRRVTMAEVIRDEYDTRVDLLPVPVFVQSGDDRYGNVDKMVLKQAGALPHGLINSVATKLGERGEILLDYVRWVRDRVLHLRLTPDYQPKLHFDCYGTVGIAFDDDTERIADYLASLGAAAAPFRLRIEQPVDAGSTTGQIAAMADLRAALAARDAGVDIVADEWCNTVDDIERFVAARAADVVHVKTPDLGGVHHTAQALLTVRRAGLAAYCGGTCNETERSAQVSAHVAMACGADQVLAKPGMGVDEGLAIVGNEMDRVAALAVLRRSGTHRPSGSTRWDRSPTSASSPANDGVPSPAWATARATGRPPGAR